MLIDRLKSLFSSRYLRNIGWLGGAEVVQRVFQLATTVALARNFSAADYGMMSVIYTIFGFANIISGRGGISAKIIQADEEELEEVCQTAYSLNWLFLTSLLVFQCLIAYPVAHFVYHEDRLVLPICVLALSYLIMPSYLVQASLLERQNLLKVKAWCTSVQAIVKNVLLVGMAILGYGVWSVVLSTVIGFLVWPPIISRFSDWKPVNQPQFSEWRPILSFGGKRLGVDLSNRFRREIDNLLVGAFLGIEALGIYVFAYNAGIGISQSLINALESTWYPYFCEVRRDRKLLKARFFNALKTIGLTILPLVILQSCMAPFYVPLLLGEAREDAIPMETAIPILILICFSAVPVALEKAVSRVLQATDQLKLDMAWNAAFAVAFAGILMLVIKYGVLKLAIAVLLIRWTFIPLFSFYIVRRMFFKKEQTTLGEI